MSGTRQKTDHEPCGPCRRIARTLRTTVERDAASGHVRHERSPVRCRRGHVVQWPTLQERSP